MSFDSKGGPENPAKERKYTKTLCAPQKCPLGQCLCSVISSVPKSFQVKIELLTFKTIYMRVQKFGVSKILSIF